MAVLHDLGEEIININEEAFIILTTEAEEVYVQKNVTFLSGNERIDIGSYYTHNSPFGYEWMEYNSDFIVLMRENKDECGFKTLSVYKLFDIKSKQFVGGTTDELINDYNNIFKGICKRK